MIELWWLGLLILLPLAYFTHTASRRGWAYTGPDYYPALPWSDPAHDVMADIRAAMQPSPLDGIFVAEGILGDSEWHGLMPATLTLGGSHRGTARDESTDDTQTGGRHARTTL